MGILEHKHKNMAIGGGKLRGLQNPIQLADTVISNTPFLFPVDPKLHPEFVSQRDSA